MNRPPLSAVLIVKDGETHLAEVLAAARAAGCDELLVLDSGSRDRTVVIAQAAGARVEHQEFLGYGPQKRHAISLASHDWVLLLDDDEILDPAAQAAVAALDRHDIRCCWRIHRRNFVGPSEIRHGIFGNERVIRLFNRQTTTVTATEVHESVAPAPVVRDLPGSLIHRSFSDGADLFARLGGFSRRKAARYRTEGRRAGWPVLLARAALTFTKSFVLKGGFRDGRLGLLVALSAAVDAVLGLALASED